MNDDYILVGENSPPIPEDEMTKIAFSIAHQAIQGDFTWVMSIPQKDRENILKQMTIHMENILELSPQSRDLPEEQKSVRNDPNPQDNMTEEEKAKAREFLDILGI